MSTASQIERARAIVAAADAVRNLGGAVAAGADDRATCLATTEAAATAAVETARQAMVAPQAVVVVAAVLRVEMEREPVGGS